MKDATPAARSLAGAHARILVVDDDRRVRELLEIALSAQGYNVLTAADGDEAVQRAIHHRPDLVVLDMRLPKRSGLEVCEILRRDPDDPSVPIILVSAQAETDARLQAFSRGADDYLPKPFSPKELVARVQRLLSRSIEARAALKRANELERELARARDDARRAHEETLGEQRRRDLSTRLGRELLDTTDLDLVGDRLLAAAQARLRVECAGLLAREKTGGPLVPRVVRGDGFERIASLSMRPDGDLAAVLAGLGRPALRAELERLPELRHEVAALVAARMHLLAPIVGPAGLEGLLVLDERLDGTSLGRADLAELETLCGIGAVALHNARRFRDQSERLLETLVEWLPAATARDPHVIEAADAVERAARLLRLPPGAWDLLGHAVRFTAFARTPEGARAIERLRPLDPTGRMASLARLISRAECPSTLANAWSADAPDVSLLLVAGLALAEAQARGAALEEAVTAACDAAGPSFHPAMRHALGEAAREASRLHVDAGRSKRSA